jgi:stage III sporulation protein SpoIIIAA
MADFFKKLESTVVKIANNVMGRSITYNLNPEATSESIKGVFSNAYIEVNGVTTTHPVLRINGEDLDRRPSIKDTVVIDAVTYKVNEVREDGFGGYTLLVKQ